MRSRLRALAAALGACALAAGLVAGCGDDDDEGGNGGAGQSTTGGGDVVVGWANPNASNPILAAITTGERKAAEGLGWTIRESDATLSPDKQVSQIDGFVAQKVKGLTTWTLNPAAGDAAYQRVRDAGIPIVGFNSPSKFVNTVVATELSSSCRPFDEEAKYIDDRIPNASVVVIGGPPVPALIMRVQCFEKAAKRLGMRIVAKQNNLKDSADGAQPLVADILTANPDVDAIWAYNDPSAQGASAALAQANKTVWSGDRKGVIVVGNNADQAGIDLIKQGQMTLTADENPVEAGARAIEALRPVLEEGKPVSAMPKRLLVRATLYDRENVDDYVPWNERPVPGAGAQ